MKLFNCPVFVFDIVMINSIIKIIIIYYLLRENKKMASIGMNTAVEGTMDEVKTKVVNALKAQGFGIITEIDMQKTLKDKINVDIEPYLILGACNPKFAHRALSADRTLGLLLPCNVVLREAGSRVEVSFQDPEVMFSVADAGTNEDLAKLPLEVKQRLQEALASL